MFGGRVSGPWFHARFGGRRSDYSVIIAVVCVRGLSRLRIQRC